MGFVTWNATHSSTTSTPPLPDKATACSTANPLDATYPSYRTLSATTTVTLLRAGLTVETAAPVPPGAWKAPYPTQCVTSRATPKPVTSTMATVCSAHQGAFLCRRLAMATATQSVTVFFVLSTRTTAESAPRTALLIALGTGGAMKSVSPCCVRWIKGTAGWS